MADVTQHGSHRGPPRHLRLARDLDERCWLLWMLSGALQSAGVQKSWVRQLGSS